VTYASTAVDDDEAWALSRAAVKVIFRSEDFKEGQRAFAEKRLPEWTGR
jgi:enoyl-CoA hydratase